MIRRDFLRLGVSGGVAGLAMTGASAPAAAAEPEVKPKYAPPPILKSYTAEDHRRRLQSIAFCQRAIRGCMRKHLITSYLPAQACYNLGEYPSKTRWEPNDYDEQELDRFRDHGIQIIQAFDDWNDSIRLFGGDKYHAVNPEGFHKFVDMVHRRGMKILPYTSTGFIQRTDPDFRPEWAREGDFLVLGFWNMARCSPASAGWRAFLFPRLLEVMDEYGFDGIYNDGGYLANMHNGRGAATPDEVLAFEETADYDGAFADILALMYAEVKRRGGILKLHVNGAEQPMTRGMKVYDYLWVGEGVDNQEKMREQVKNYPPYLVPCPDMTFAKVENKDEPYLNSIPYMQFPIFQGGRPFTGERAMVPGVAYNPQDDFWMQKCREAWRLYQANPNGPFSYSAWDALPGRPETRPTHAYWLKRYLPLSEEGTWAWLETADTDLFSAPLPKNVVASAFANREVYLVLANYGQEPAEIATRDTYTSTDSAAAAPQKNWRLNGRSLDILRLTS